MHAHQILSSLVGKAMDLLAWVNNTAESQSDADIARALGVTDAEVNSMKWAYGFFGTEQARAAARPLPLATIMSVARGMNRVKNSTTVDQEEALRTLTEIALGADRPTEAEALIKDQVAKWNTASPTRKADTLNFENTIGSDGKLQIVGRMDADRASEIREILNHIARRFQASNPDKPLSVARADALYHAICQSHGSEDRYRNFTPNFLIPIAADEAYFADGHLATSGGALINVADIVNEELGRYGYATVVALDSKGIPQFVDALEIIRLSDDPITVGDAVGRFATPKQRFAMATETLMCSHPECVRPAVDCQADHIVEWSRGGPTVQENLAALCHLHNGRKDIQGTPPKWGRVARDPVDGTPGWAMTPESPTKVSRMPAVAKGWRAWAAGVYGLR